MTNDAIGQNRPGTSGNHSGTTSEPLGTSDLVQVVPAPTHTFVESVGGGSTPSEPLQENDHVANAVANVVTLIQLAELYDDWAAKFGPASGSKFGRLFAERAAAIRWALERLV
jgi:hypothetical protein